MTERPPKTILPRDPIARALFAWKAAMTALTVVTWLFSYLSALATASPACAGMNMPAGYHSDLTDYLAMPLLSFGLLVGLMLRVTTTRARDMITSNDLGLFLFYPVLLLFVGFFGLTTGASVVRYHTIAIYCEPAHAHERGSQGAGVRTSLMRAI